MKIANWFVYIKRDLQFELYTVWQYSRVLLSSGGDNGKSAPSVRYCVCVCVRRARYTRFDDVMHILAAPKKLEFQIFREIFSFPFCCCHFVVAWIKIYNPMNTNALRKSQMITFAIKKKAGVYRQLQCSIFVCVYSTYTSSVVFVFIRICTLALFSLFFYFYISFYKLFHE